jgi:hypothetical protein
MLTTGPVGKTIVCDDVTNTNAITLGAADSTTSSALRASAEVVKTGTPDGGDFSTVRVNAVLAIPPLVGEANVIVPDETLDVGGSESVKPIVVLTPVFVEVADEGRAGNDVLAEPHCAKKAIAVPATIMRP